MPSKTIILLNPAARHGKALKLLERALEVFRRQQVRFDVRESQSAEHLTELARAASEEQPDLIVSAGGDGTFHYIVNGLVNSQVPLGVLPLGRGNDFATGVGMPMDLSAAASALLNGRIRKIDLARVGKTMYGCIAGMGFDSTVNRYANEHAQWLSGTFAYAWSFLCCMHEYRPRKIEIIADGKSFSDQVLFAVVGNNASYGGGIRITPRARLDDGVLDICIVPYMNPLELLRWVPRAYRGEHLAHPRVKYLQAGKITLCSASPMQLYGDGEFLQELPATIEALPRALRVIAPAY